MSLSPDQVQQARQLHAQLGVELQASTINWTSVIALVMQLLQLFLGG